MGMFDGIFWSPAERARLARLQQQQDARHQATVVHATQQARLRQMAGIGSPVQQMLDVMRIEGDKFPNLGKAHRRLKNRKHVESCDVTSVAHRQITGVVEAVKEAQENAK